MNCKEKIKSCIITILHYVKIICEFTKTFFDMSTIHGFQQISSSDRHIAERILWVVLVALTAYGSLILSNLSLTKYTENSTVISIERDRFEWNTSFPPLTICPDTKYNVTKIEIFLNENNTIKNKTLFKAFIISLTQASYLNLETVIEYEDIPGEQFVELIDRFKYDFKLVITKTVESIMYTEFVQIFTELGVCYSFFSPLSEYNSLEYWNTGSWKLLPEKHNYFINALDGEALVTLNNISTGFQIYPHSPYDIIDIVSKKWNARSGEKLELYFKALNIFASDRIKDLRIKQRNCRFYHESNLLHFPFYSYVACRMDCRANFAKKFCGCLPHFYRNREGEKVCDVKGLHCLSRYREKIIFMKEECVCSSNCDETIYVVSYRESQPWIFETSLVWGIEDYPKMRLKREVIFGFSDLLVYIGGMAGLFLGCSVLSFIEIVYFFTLRLFWFLKYYKR